MKKKKFARLFCLVAALAAMLCALCSQACDCGGKTIPTTAVELKESLKEYVGSKSFADTLLSVNSAQDRLPLLYLKYASGKIYSEESAKQFEKYLSFIDELKTDGEIDDAKFENSAAQKQGWYCITDYLYAYSLVYNQYAKYLADENISQNKYAANTPAIERYIKKIDAALQRGEQIGYVAWGYTATDILPLTAANLGIKNAVPYCDGVMLSHYEKNAQGSFEKEGGTPNWVGFTGRPLAGSLYRNNEKYDVEYEKTMQGYFPFTDGYDQPLDEMINLDRLCNYYNHTIATGESVAPQYALMTAMMHGIDMENYKKTKSLAEFGETGEEVFNVISMWRSTLKKDGDKFVIDNLADMAVAIAYIAQCYGVDAPTPLGEYSPSLAVIEL